MYSFALNIEIDVLNFDSISATDGHFPDKLNIEV